MMDDFMHQEEISYKIGSETFKGFLAFPDEAKTNPRPAVLIAHAWKGRDDFACDKARAMAALGYVALAADMYGNGIAVDTSEEAITLMMPIISDRALLQKRIRASFEVLSAIPEVNKDKIGAMGFCFGGLTVIELLRSGAPVKAVVSFHGVLGNQFHGVQAKTVPIAKEIKGSLLILHGHDDPLSSSQDILNIQTEMTKANVDWQMNIYGHATHAFTNQQVSDKKSGLAFEPKANVRSWEAMNSFFNELLK